jgi:hypothetical protein
VNGCNGACCAGGTQCCSNGACQTQHSNGLGQSYFDCNPIYTPAQTTQTAAMAAADAWSAGTTIVGTICDPYCLSRQTGSQCATWCYGGSNFAGLVRLNTANNACLCPTVQSRPWN